MIIDVAVELARAKAAADDRADRDEDRGKEGAGEPR
jgi:hypothetical protein